MKRLFYFFLALIIFPSNFVFSQEDEDKHPYLTNKFTIGAGIFTPSKTLHVEAEGSTPNNVINFDETFDLNERETTFAGNVRWRFSKNWNVGVEYFAIKNGHTVSLEEDIEWGDNTYKAGLEVGGGFEIDMFRVFFGRNISTGKKHELGGGLGIHVMDILTFVQGEAFIGELNTGFKKEALTALAPLPNIGLWYYFTPSPKFLLMARVDWLSVKIGTVSGRLWNVAPGIQYQLFKNIGISASYRYFDLNVDIAENTGISNVNLRIDGPLFGITGNF